MMNFSNMICVMRCSVERPEVYTMYMTGHLMSLVDGLRHARFGLDRKHENAQSQLGK